MNQQRKKKRKKKGVIGWDLTFDNSVSFQWRHDYVEDPESDETQTG